jgi:hypothetical protein
MRPNGTGGRRRHFDCAPAGPWTDEAMIMPMPNIHLYHLIMHGDHKAKIEQYDHSLQLN